jgi:putative transcriptional regulator
MDSIADNLTGKLLIAMPGLDDARFEASVVYICAHSDEGAMGLIVNKAAQSVSVDDVFKQLDIRVEETLAPMLVHYGGPVEMGRGFVLHGADYESGDASMAVSDDVIMTASKDILEDIGAGVGPQARLLCLGYAGWEPSQLEDELSQNVWLVCEAPFDVLFEVKNEDKWAQALHSMGVSPALLSSVGGQA